MAAKHAIGLSVIEMKALDFALKVAAVSRGGKFEPETYAIWESLNQRFFTIIPKCEAIDESRRKEEAT